MSICAIHGDMIAPLGHIPCHGLVSIQGLANLIKISNGQLRSQGYCALVGLQFAQ
jgi:hypothetical protein